MSDGLLGCSTVVLMLCVVCADDNSRVMLSGASNDYINASHLKVISVNWH